MHTAMRIEPSRSRSLAALGMTVRRDRRPQRKWRDVISMLYRAELPSCDGRDSNRPAWSFGVRYERCRACGL